MIQDENLKWQDEEALNRFQMITPLLDEKLDRAKKNELIHKIAEDNVKSVRTIQRYLAAYKESGFSGLRPTDRSSHVTSKLPDNFDELLANACELKRQVPSRSVEQIIFILEGEDLVAPGVLKRSTLQRYLYNAGFGKKQMKKYMEGQKSSTSRRFCKPNRMMLTQADIKYGVGIVYKQNGKSKTAYLSSIIDDHSRYILASEWYDNQCEYVVEDIFRKAILKRGRFDKSYCDNGSQYISKQLKLSCSKLGIRIIHAKPYAGWSKGKIEKFHQVVDKFIAEVKLQKVDSLSEINRLWQIFLEEGYHKKPHDGIKEYYQSKGVSIPDGGISPEMEWNRDSRPLVYIDANMVAEAFMYHCTRVVDKGGCISFKGRKYEVSESLIGATVEVAFDPNDFTTLTIHYANMDKFEVHQIEIGEYCSKKQEVPEAMKNDEPQVSRLLRVLEKKNAESQRKYANAISYSALEEDQ